MTVAMAGTAAVHNSAATGMTRRIDIDAPRHKEIAFGRDARQESKSDATIVNIHRVSTLSIEM
jgi:hypothetical protein